MHAPNSVQRVLPGCDDVEYSGYGTRTHISHSAMTPGRPQIAEQREWRVGPALDDRLSYDIYELVVY